MRALSFVSVLAFLAATAAFAQPRPDQSAGGVSIPAFAFDHHDPVLLNESAVDRVRRGDVETAWILLERAARLAPHDPRIRHNLREIRAFRTGRPAPPEVFAPAAREDVEPAVPAAREDAGPVVPAEPPALWSPR